MDTTKYTGTLEICNIVQFDTGWIKVTCVVSEGIYCGHVNVGIVLHTYERNCAPLIPELLAGQDETMPCLFFFAMSLINLAPTVRDSESYLYC